MYWEITIPEIMEHLFNLIRELFIQAELNLENSHTLTYLSFEEFTKHGVGASCLGATGNLPSAEDSDVRQRMMLPEISRNLKSKHA